MSSWNTILDEELCDKCREIKLTPLPKGSLHHTLADLRSSAQHGCVCCKLILNELLNLEQSAGTVLSSEYPSQITVNDFPDLYGKGKMCYMFEDPNYKSPFTVWFEFFDRNGEFEALFVSRGILMRFICLSDMFNNSDERIVGIKVGRYLVENLNSVEGQKIIHDWIYSCLTTHSLCSQVPSALPTRVLDLSEETPRLVDGDNTEAQYISLSHCWGGVPLLTTTVATLEKWKNGIPLSSFPATFADAISLTKKLNIRYLWIDSLCIIQDSVEE